MADNTYWRASDVYVNPDIEGYLTEKKLMRNAKIWCCLQGATLYLHKNQGAVIQTIDMATEVQSVRKMLETSAQFEINHKKGKHTFICPSPTICTDWVTALQKAMSLKSNGIGRSVFHGVIPDGPDDTDLNVYAMPSDDALTQQGQATTQPDYSVYDDVGPQQPVSSDTGQNSTNINIDRDSHRPPLPPMHSRLARAPAVDLENYVEPSPDAASQAKENEYADVTAIRLHQQVEYTDGVTACESKSNDPQEDDVYTDAASSSNPTASGTDGVQFRKSKYSTSLSLTENGVDEEEGEEDEIDQADVFAELEKALTSPGTPNLELECPLKEEDYQPAKEIHMFLAHNSYLLHGVSQRFMFQNSDQDPVATLKDFLKEIEG